MRRQHDEAAARRRGPRRRTRRTNGVAADELVLHRERRVGANHGLDRPLPRRHPRRACASAARASDAGRWNRAAMRSTPVASATEAPRRPGAANRAKDRAPRLAAEPGLDRGQRRRGAAHLRGHRPARNRAGRRRRRRRPPTTPRLTRSTASMLPARSSVTLTTTAALPSLTLTSATTPEPSSCLIASAVPRSSLAGTPSSVRAAKRISPTCLKPLAERSRRRPRSCGAARPPRAPAGGAPRPGPPGARAGRRERP